MLLSYCNAMFRETVPFVMKKKIQNKNIFRPTYPNFFDLRYLNTTIFFFWPNDIYGSYFWTPYKLGLRMYYRAHIAFYLVAWSVKVYLEEFPLTNQTDYISLSPNSTANWARVGQTTRMKWAQTTWNVHGQRENVALGTQRNLYSIGLLWGFALGVRQILCFASGVRQNLAFLDTNMLVYPTQNFALGVLSNATREVLRCSGI